MTAEAALVSENKCTHVNISEISRESLAASALLGSRSLPRASGNITSRECMDRLRQTREGG